MAMMKKILPILVLAGLLGAAWFVKNNPPEAAQRRERPPPRLSVETLRLAAQDFSIPVQSYGTVKPRTQTQLLPRVSGEITAVGEHFREGAFFDKGELLLQIDPRDYQVVVQRAEAALVQAQQALVQERAQAKQAREDWQRLGKRGQPSSLVLRLPQQKAAEAKILSAKADLSRAKLDLERTRIYAPYAGRILRKNVDVGQSVSSGNVLAELYATDYVEVRLPLKNNDLAFVQLPERFRHSDKDLSFPKVTLVSQLVGRETWEGRIVRTEGALDSATQQLYVIAQIDDPYGPAAGERYPLKIGQYMTAEIQGRLIEDVITIPNSTIYQGSYVYVVEKGVLQRREIDIAWQGQERALVSQGLQVGDQLVTTLLGQVTSGTRVDDGQRKKGPKPAAAEAQAKKVSDS